METGSISRKIERGKHTTRHSELIPVDEDSYIMDTPGFSSLYTNDFEKEEMYHPVDVELKLNDKIFTFDEVGASDVIM